MNIESIVYFFYKERSNWNVKLHKRLIVYVSRLHVNKFTCNFVVNADNVPHTYICILWLSNKNSHPKYVIWQTFLTRYSHFTCNTVILLLLIFYCRWTFTISLNEHSRFHKQTRVFLLTKINTTIYWQCPGISASICSNPTLTCTLMKILSYFTALSRTVFSAFFCFFFFFQTEVTFLHRNSTDW